MPILTEPFSHISIDLVGPISPSEGHRYILTLIDFATGFPEALPLKEIDLISAAEALMVIFSRVVTNHENGTVILSPHYSLRERFLAIELGFLLLYGRTVRGPLSVLRALWEDTTIKDDVRSSFQYVIELKDKLEECAKIAAQNAEISSSKFKSYFDLKSQDRKFSPGEEVLVLLPDNQNKLLMSWSGPYTVLECRNKMNYLIDEGGKQKLLHANLLKKYHRRATTSQPNVMDEETEQKSDIDSVIAEFGKVFSLTPCCTNTPKFDRIEIFWNIVGCLLDWCKIVSLGIRENG
ncbi:uncharacterized protein [Penaeus vannamei]|uniref:uncharacterized protein n=1 Tax=Penaeus vannamei TaxID=6689 RepID=UPI00387F71D7